MLGKGSVALQPLVLWGILRWRRRLTWRDWLRLLPFVVVAAALTAVNIWFRTHGDGSTIRSVGWADRLAGAGYIVWFYLYKAILPLHLAFVYPQWQIDAARFICWLPMTAAMVVAGVLWRYRQSWGRPFVLAGAYFCAALLPVMGFADVYFMKFSLVADHYQQPALVAVTLLFAALLAQRRDALRSVAAYAAAAVVFCFAILTWQQNLNYRDAISLYETALNRNPDSWLLHYNLGVGLQGRRSHGGGANAICRDAATESR